MQKSTGIPVTEPKQFFEHKNGMKTAFDIVFPSQGQLSCRDRKAKFAHSKAIENGVAAVAIDNFGDGDSSGTRGEITPLDWQN